MSKRKRTSLEEKWAAEMTDTGGPDAVSGGPQPVDDTTVVELREQIQQLNDQLLRQKAEMANFRRRMERDRDERVEASRASLVAELLPVVDDFDRAVRADTDHVDAYRQGVELILKSLHDALARIGVERIEPHGEPFDPHRHEAVEQRPTDSTAPGNVVNVYKPGYLLGDRLVRPASVVVSVTPTEPGEAAVPREADD